MTQGLFIALEGIDGSGTTTHTKMLANWLSAQGKKVIQTHEPTDDRIGRLIRRILQDSAVPPAIDALLFAADRIDNTVHRIQPALKEGKIVITDRYVESSIAYQSSSGLEIDWIKHLNRFALTPDLTILLDISPSIALKRKRRPQPKEKFEHTLFLDKVRQVFLRRAQELDFKIVNAEDSINEVQTAIQKHVETHFTSLK